MMWNASQKQYDGFENGDFIQVKGASQLYNGGMQVLAKGITKVAADNIDETEFTTLSNSALEKMTSHSILFASFIYQPMSRTIYL